MSPLKSIFLFGLLTAATGATAAQPTNTFPFGMETVKWKISYAEVKQILSPSIPEMRAPIGAPTTDQREYFWGPLAFKACTLQIWTFFANDKLDYIYVGPAYVGAVLGPVAETCKTAMEDELVPHFGETPRKEFISPVTHKDMGIIMNWKTPETSAIYGDARVNLYEVGGPQPTFYDFIGPPVSK